MLNSAASKSIQDIMRKRVGVADAEGIGQLTWQLFPRISMTGLKIF